MLHFKIYPTVMREGDSVHVFPWRYDGSLKDRQADVIGVEIHFRPRSVGVSFLEKDPLFTEQRNRDF